MAKSVLCFRYGRLAVRATIHNSAVVLVRATLDPRESAHLSRSSGGALRYLFCSPQAHEKVNISRCTGNSAGSPWNAAINGSKCRLVEVTISVRVRIRVRVRVRVRVSYQVLRSGGLWESNPEALGVCL